MLAKLIALAFLPLGAAVAGAQTSSRYILPDAVSYPEGIARDPDGSAVYLAASADSQIVRINLRDGSSRLIGTGLPDRRDSQLPIALGLNIDARGRLWIAGGRAGDIRVVDRQTGAPIQTIATAEGAGFINDLTFAGGKAYLTDTVRPMLWAVPVGKTLPAKAEPWLDLSDSPIAYAPGRNLNGIVATRDGRTLITGHMDRGLLFKIDVATRKITPIDLGGETVTGADGLVLRGRTLYVVRQGAAEIVTIQLAADFASGKVVKRSMADGLRSPATAVIAGSELLVVNAQFPKRATNDPERPFSVQRLPLAALSGQ